MHYAIWNREEAWPADTDTHVFIARAVQRVGRAMHGSEWLGYEVKVRAKGIPLARGGEMTILFVPRRLGRPGKMPPPNPHPPIEDEPAALRRVEKVYRAIVAACQSGKLETAARARIGGEIHELPKSVWNTERWRSRFETGELDVEHPFQHPFKRDQGSWIFIGSRTLSQFLLTLADQPPSDVELPHLSPYLRVLLAVAKKLDITPDHQPLKKTVIAELEASWKGESPLSDSLLRAMGTILREPESGLGKARKQKK